MCLFINLLLIKTHSWYFQTSLLKLMSEIFFDHIYIYIWNRRNYFSNIFSLQIQFLIQTMGNTVTNSSREKKSKKNCKVEFYNKLKTSEVGQELVACSFGAWCREQRKVCGFSDKADYTSSRHSLLQPSGSPNRPDTTEGRFFRSGFK